MPLKGKLSLTSRDFPIFKFRDFYGTRCHVQESSIILEEERGGREGSMELPGSSALWMGVEPGQSIPPNKAFPEPCPITLMHLSLDQVKGLIEVLQKWVETGKLGEL